MHDWRAILLRPDDTMAGAIETLEREALRIVLVTDAEHRLLGAVTDGDVRRALMRRCTMETPLAEIMFRQPAVAPIDADRKEILALLKSRDLLQIPLVDRQGRVVGLETLQHLTEPQRYDNPVFLMAGGFGKRLRPLTDDTPKPLLKVGAKPILETLLERCIESGFHRFYISTHYRADMVRKHFGNGEKWGATIHYIHEERPLGTAGALGLLPEALPELPLLMMNGDLLTAVNFSHLLRFHRERGGVATLCVREYDLQVPYGVVYGEGERMQRIVEKPVHHFFINAGIYVLEPTVAKNVRVDEPIDMPDLLARHAAQGDQVNLFPLHEYWIDIGRIEELERANSGMERQARVG